MERRKYSDEERAALVAEYRESGQTREAFCRTRGVSKSVLYRALSRESLANDARVTFAEVVRGAASSRVASNAAVVIEFGALRIHVEAGASRALLSDVLAAARGGA